jgi:uncharacterized protein (DUF1810 family)
MNDLYDLNRFVIAQQADYAVALREIRQGLKVSHWMWYIFPQIAGLGFSETSRYYAIKSKNEVIAYLKHPILGARLIEITDTVLHLEGLSANEIFGELDALKLHSCMTLFNSVNPEIQVFKQVLLKYFEGKQDKATLDLFDNCQWTIT